MCGIFGSRRIPRARGADDELFSYEQPTGNRAGRRWIELQARSQLNGEREYESLLGTSAAVELAAIREMSPDVYDTLISHAFGGTLARPELERPVREIATLAILAATGDAETQITTHARAALRLGVSASELLALCEHVAVYAGFPRALNALRIVHAALTAAGETRPLPTRPLQLRDHNTVVAAGGTDGPPVVLLHALGLDWRMWEPVIGEIAGGRRVYAYDLRGHGRATGSPTPFTMDDIAADLIALLDALELDTAHVVGLSYGGGVAQTAALVAPERFASLSLLATTDFAFASFEDRARAAETDGMEAQIVPSLTRWFAPADLATNHWGVRYARERVRRAHPADWAGAWRAFAGLAVQDGLAGFPAPVLVLAGEVDSSTTPDIMNGIAGRIPGSLYRELPETPHMQTLSRPLLVAEALDDFLPRAGDRHAATPSPTA
jgi:3-oxoadipate enol-lactonase